MPQALFQISFAGNHSRCMGCVPHPPFKEGLPPHRSVLAGGPPALLYFNLTKKTGREEGMGPPPLEPIWRGRAPHAYDSGPLAPSNGGAPLPSSHPVFFIRLKERRKPPDYTDLKALIQLRHAAAMQEVCKSLGFLGIYECVL